MKKKLAILLAVLLFCSTLTPALAGFRLSKVYSACVFQDVLYYLQDEKIWLRKTHLDPEELFIDLAEWPQIPEGQKKTSICYPIKMLFICSIAGMECCTTLQTVICRKL